MGSRVRRTKNRPTWAALAGMDTRVSERRKGLVDGGFSLIRGCACKTALGCASREISPDPAQVELEPRGWALHAETLQDARPRGGTCGPHRQCWRRVLVQASRSVAILCT